MDENQIIVSPDEAKAEQEAQAEVGADKLRASIVAELGIADDEANKGLIDKLVERDTGSRKKLSEAIGQKIGYREKLKGLKPPQNQPGKPLDAETIRQQTTATVTEQLEQRDLDEMEYPDDIKAEIKKLSKVLGVSIRKAEKDPYVQSLIQRAVKAGKIDEAALSRTPRATPAAKNNGEMPKFDMSTAEGRKAFDEWKKAKQEKN